MLGFTLLPSARVLASDIVYMKDGATLLMYDLSSWSALALGLATW